MAWGSTSGSGSGSGGGWRRPPPPAPAPTPTTGFADGSDLGAMAGLAAWGANPGPPAPPPGSFGADGTDLKAVEGLKAWGAGNGALPGQAPLPATTAAPAAPAAPTSNTPTSPQQGLFDQPGWGEQWYEKNKGAWDQPSQSSQYWNGVSGAFSGGKVMPTNTQNAYGTLQSTLGQPGQGTTQAYGNASQLSSSTPWAGQSHIQSSLPFFGTAGSGESFAKSQLGYFSGPGQMEQAYPGLVNELNGIQFGGQAVGVASQGAGRAQMTQAITPGMLQFAGQNPIGDEYSNYFAGGLRGPSNSETLYDSGQGERNLTTYYGRAQEKQARALNDQMAARGLFGSGAAIRGQEELGADIGAAQARDMASMAAQADQARLGRGAQALSFTSAADASQQGRRRLGLDTAVASDSGNRANAGLMLDAYGMASGEALNRTSQKASAAASAQGLGIQRTTSGINSALSADRLGLDRTTAGVNAAHTLDSDLASRMFQGGNLGISADGAERARADTLFQGANTLDSANATAERDYINKLVGGTQAAGTADTAERARLTGGSNAAGDAQRLFEGRNMSAYNIDNGLSTQLSNLVGGQGDKGIADYVNGQLVYINGLVSQGKMSAEAGQAKSNELLSLLSGIAGKK